jgi:hypothetical protein
MGNVDSSCCFIIYHKITVSNVTVWFGMLTLTYAAMLDGSLSSPLVVDGRRPSAVDGSCEYIQ